MGDAMNIAPLIGELDGLNCCKDNHIGRCFVSNKNDNTNCDQNCRDSHCGRGGHCKIIGKKVPKHVCHCNC